MEFFESLVTAIASPKSSEEYEQSVKLLLDLREQDNANFIVLIFNSFEIFNHISKQIDLLLIILGYQTIRNCRFTEEYLKLDECFVKKIIGNVFMFLKSKDIELQSNAATLFSHLINVDIDNDNRFNIMSLFFSWIQNEEIDEILFPLSIIVNDLFENNDFDDDVIYMIYSLISNLIDEEINDSHKWIISILMSLMDSFAIIINIPDVFLKISNFLFRGLLNKFIQEYAFMCLSSIVKHYYQLIEPIIPFICSSNFFEIINNESSDEMLFLFCEFWSIIAKIEFGCESSYNIIDFVCLDLIPILFEISSYSKNEKSDDDDINTPQTMATISLGCIINESSDKCKTLLESLIDKYWNSSIEGKREASLSIIHFMFSFYSLNEINFPKYFIIIKNGLNDEFPRVRQNSLYCIDKICEIIGFNDKTEYFIQNVIDKLINDTLIIDDVIRVVGNFFTLKGFPFFQVCISTLLKMSLNSEINIALIIFTSLSQAILSEDYSILYYFLNKLILLLSSDFTFNQWYIEQISNLIVQLIYKLDGKIDDQFDILWNLFTTKLSDYNAILPLSALIGSSLNEDKFKSVIMLILYGLNSEHFIDSSQGLKIIASKYDLSPYFIKVYNSLLSILMNNDIQIYLKRIPIEALSCLLSTKYSYEICSKNIFDCVEILMNSIISIDDDDVIASFLKLLQMFLGYNSSFILPTIFKVFNLICNFHNINIYLFDEYINSILLIHNLFPQELNIYYEKNPYLETIIQMGLRNDNFDLAKVETVLDIFR